MNIGLSIGYVHIFYFNSLDIRDVWFLLTMVSIPVISGNRFSNRLSMLSLQLFLLWFLFCFLELVTLTY